MLKSLVLRLRYREQVQISLGPKHLFAYDIFEVNKILKCFYVHWNLFNWISKLQGRRNKGGEWAAAIPIFPNCSSNDPFLHSPAFWDFSTLPFQYLWFPTGNLIVITYCLGLTINIDLQGTVNLPWDKSIRRISQMPIRKTSN